MKFSKIAVYSALFPLASASLRGGNISRGLGLDEDTDGEEFDFEQECQVVPSTMEIAAHFNNFDTEGNGLLDIEEFTDLMETYCPSIAESQANNLQREFEFLSGNTTQVLDMNETDMIDENIQPKTESVISLRSMNNRMTIDPDRYYTISVAGGDLFWTHTQSSSHGYMAERELTLLPANRISDHGHEAHFRFVRNGNGNSWSIVNRQTGMRLNLASNSRGRVQTSFNDRLFNLEFVDFDQVVIADREQNRGIRCDHVSGCASGGNLWFRRRERRDREGCHDGYGTNNACSSHFGSGWYTVGHWRTPPLCFWAWQGHTRCERIIEWQRGDNDQAWTLQEVPFTPDHAPDVVTREIVSVPPGQVGDGGALMNAVGNAVVNVAYGALMAAGQPVAAYLFYGIGFGALSITNYLVYGDPDFGGQIQTLASEMQEFVLFALSNMGAEDWIHHASNSLTDGLNEATTRSHRSFTSQKLSNIANPLAPDQDNPMNRQLLVDRGLSAASLFEGALVRTQPQGGFNPSDNSQRGQANAGLVRLGWNTVMRPSFTLLLLSYLEVFKALAYQWSLDRPDNGCTFDDVWEGTSATCSETFDGYKNVIDQWYNHMKDSREFALTRRMDNFGFTQTRSIGRRSCCVAAGTDVVCTDCNPGRWNHDIRDNLNQANVMIRQESGGCVARNRLQCITEPNWFPTYSNALSVKNNELERDLNLYYEFEQEEELYKIFEELARESFDRIYNNPEEYVREVEIQRLCYYNPSHSDCVDNWHS